MDCGADDYICLTLSWLTENEFIATSVAEYAGRAGASVAGSIGTVAAVLKEHAQAIIGLFGISFGIYKWWRYREQILHKRLSEYLRENDLRLKDGQTYFLEALQRPGVTIFARTPLFVNHELRSVLRERRWDTAVVAASVEKSADSQLHKATQIIERQIRSAEDAITSLREQCATANLLRGAIVASRDSMQKESATALDFFRSVLKLPGQEENILAKEFEAHQLKKLGWLTEAMAAYEDFERFAGTIRNDYDRGLAIARAKRYQAELHQAEAIREHKAGRKDTPGSGRARDLMNKSTPPGALIIRSKFGPYSDWDLIESGDMSYFMAFVWKNFQYRPSEDDCLKDARYAYQKALDAAPPWYRKGSRRLRARAQEGLERVKKARSGTYAEYENADFQSSLSKKPVR